jgi:hypothetical protein
VLYISAINYWRKHAMRGTKMTFGRRSLLDHKMPLPLKICATAFYSLKRM